MEKKEKLQVLRTPISIEDIQRKDIIALDLSEDSTLYEVLDVGTPFILIEDTKTHFASLYRPHSTIYKCNLTCNDSIIINSNSNSN